MIQMNIRIDEALKTKGDKVFARYDLNPSAVVRAVWQYAAETGELPACVFQQETKDQSVIQQKLDLVDGGKGLAARLLSVPYPTEDDLSYDELRTSAYEEKLAQHEATYTKSSS